MIAAEDEFVEGEDNSGALDSLNHAERLLAQDTLSADASAFAKQNPLFFLLSPSVYNGQLAPGPIMGRAHYKDTAQINAYLNLPQVRAIMPTELVPMWTVKADQGDKSGIIYNLIAIKSTSRDGKAPLDGGVITDAKISYGNTGGSPSVSMSMNAEGARTWARLTADNIGKSIAVVLDGMVYSFPTVRGEISGGNSEISGNFTITEAEDLSNVLKSGKLPAPATIV